MQICFYLILEAEQTQDFVAQPLAVLGGAIGHNKSDRTRSLHSLLVVKQIKPGKSALTLLGANQRRGKSGSL